MRLWWPLERVGSGLVSLGVIVSSTRALSWSYGLWWFKEVRNGVRDLVCVIPRCTGLSSSDAWSRSSVGILATSLGFVRCFCKPSSISQVNFAIWRPFWSLEVISQPFWSLEIISQSFRSLEIISQPFRSLEIISQAMGNFAAEKYFRSPFCSHFATWNEGNCAAKWHSCATEWFHSCETPFQMASRLRNSHSALCACLQITITSSFQLQIVHRLKL